LQGAAKAGSAGGARRRFGLALALAGLLLLTAAGSAQAFVYWASYQDQRIGRANNDGTGVDKNFITTGAGPFAVAVNGSHIFWANQDSNSIGRANLDGTGVNNSFILGVDEPNGVAVSGTFVFWSSIGDGAVGRANLDGSNPDLSLVPAFGVPCGVAVDSGHVYWADDGFSSYIGRAALNGGSPNSMFVSDPGISFPCGVAVNTANIFWTDTGLFGGGTNIGRANVATGGGVDASTIGDASTPCGVAIDSSHLYWANTGTNTIGRANTDSTGVNQSFINTGANQICGVAVNSLLPSNRFTIGKAKLNRRRGRARLPVRLPGAGTLTLRGTGVRRQSLAQTAASSGAAASAARTVTLKVIPRGRLNRRLSARGRARTTVRITFTPVGGTASSQRKVLRLVRR
jgi:streptogramin lyase